MARTRATIPNPTKTYTGTPRTVTARLTVTDNGSPNLADTSTPITIWIGNRAPTAAIASPANNSFYNAGQTINFSGTATDPEDGARIFDAGRRIAIALRSGDLPVDGVNLFLADGTAAGQEVFHVHLHVIPRRHGDGFGLRAVPRSPNRTVLDGTAAAIRDALSR